MRSLSRSSTNCTVNCGLLTSQLHLRAAREDEMIVGGSGVHRLLSSFLPPQPHNLKWVGGGRAGEEADAADGDGRAGERTGARIGQWHRYSDGILTPGPSVSTKLWILSRIRLMMMSRAVLLFSFKDCKTIQSIQNQHGVTSSSGRFVIKSAAWSVLIVAPRTQPLP